MKRLCLSGLAVLCAGCVAEGVPDAADATYPPTAAYRQQPFPEPEGDLAHIRAFAAGNGYTYTARQEDLAMLNYAGWRLDPAQPRGYQMVWADDGILAVNLTDEADEAAILARFAPQIRDRINVYRVAFDRAAMLRLTDQLYAAINDIRPVDSVATYNYRTGQFDVTIVGQDKADALLARMPAELRAFTNIALGEATLIAF